MRYHVPPCCLQSPTHVDLLDFRVSFLEYHRFRLLNSPYGYTQFGQYLQLVYTFRLFRSVNAPREEIAAHSGSLASRCLHGPTVGSEGAAVSYERGTLVLVAGSCKTRQLVYRDGPSSGQAPFEKSSSPPTAVGLLVPESGPLKAVHLSRRKWPGELFNQDFG